MVYKNSIESIAIGSFDGIHLAHKRLIDEVDAVVIIERNGGYLTPGYKRINFIQKPCFFYHFEQIKSLRALAFIEKLQVDFPQLKKIVVGYDFGFAYKKEGNIALLKKYFNGDVLVIDEVKFESISVHSRTIKSYLQEGSIAQTNALLGRKFEIEGKIVQGQGIGKKELVATLNLKVYDYQLPKEGVYATKTEVDGICYDSITFLGHRVTTDGVYAIETHLIGQSIEQKETVLKIVFYAFLRLNKKFENLKALKSQISEDIIEVKKIFG